MTAKAGGCTTLLVASLLEDLKKAALAIDPQFQVTTNEVSGVVSALIHHSQYGDEFLKAAEKGVDEVTKLLQPPAKQDQPAPIGEGEASGTAAAESVPPVPPTAAASPVAPDPAVTPAPASDLSNLTDAELEALASDLQAAVASRRATSQQTQVTHETDVPPTPPTGWAKCSSSSDFR